jgi:cytidyltransferase-like protein
MLLLLSPPTILDGMEYKFKRSIAGGTFDRFHVGHQKLLRTAFEQSEKVIIGIATDELFENKSFAYLIEDYAAREKSILNFLNSNSFENRSEIVPINDFLGTSLTDEELEAIFITESNKENASKINSEREKKCFKPLEIVIVDYAFGDDNEIVSSERIRKGVIDREGNSYAKLFLSQEKYVLPENIREDLRRPMGTIEKDMKEVVSSFNSNTMLIAVGDIVSQQLLEIGRPADISIVDGKTRREVLTQQFENIFQKAKLLKTENPAGTITKRGVESLLAAIADFETTQVEHLIFVSGEEDLFAIPSILLSPLQAVVVYGQFDKGIVVVHVSEQNKKHVYDLFRKFQ